MKIVTRRKFLKWALSASALLNAATIFHIAQDKSPEVSLIISKDGDATLHGVEFVVDRRKNAILTRGRNG